MSSRISTLLHISDLHLVGSITEEGGSLGLKGPKTHSFAKIEALSASLFEIEEVQNRPIDLVIITGDITTDGSQASFKTAKEFIEQDDIYRYTPQRRILRGLGSGPSSRIIVAGNHDRYGGQFWPLPYQKSNQSLEQIFSSPTQYPYAVGYRSEKVEGEEMVFVFFVFDSTLIQPDRWDFYNRIARGRIELGECSRLKELASEIRRTETILGMDGGDLTLDYDKAVKIAILHHHPVLPSNVSVPGSSKWMEIRRRLKSRLTLMENSEAFTRACFEAKVDLVLFGHQHQGYEVESPSGGGHITRFYCCPSTSEFSEKENGFNVVDFFTDRFEVEYYRWIADGLNPRAFGLARRDRRDYDRARFATKR